MPWLVSTGPASCPTRTDAACHPATPLPSPPRRGQQHGRVRHVGGALTARSNSSAIWPEPNQPRKPMRLLRSIAPLARSAAYFAAVVDPAFGASSLHAAHHATSAPGCALRTEPTAT
jgi:hypothetical protein